MDTLQPNSELQGGKYRIKRFLNSGGFGCTYEGIHTMFDTRVAIKEFFPKMFCNRDDSTSHITTATQSNRGLVDKLRKKFVDEAKAIFKMKHPNIVKVHDIFEENGTAYYVMDFIDGKSLSDMVKQRGTLTEAEAVGYIRQVADALKYVHSLNRLHLDVKPGNVMVDANNNVILIDFGASKHYDTESGENTSTLMGVNTKGYAPVEQSTRSFSNFSPATDIYALGATLYKLLTGITPPDANLLLAKEESLTPLPANISVATRTAVLKAMSLVRADRPQSIDAFLILLDGGAPLGINEEATVIGVSGKPKSGKNIIKTVEVKVPSSRIADNVEVSSSAKNRNYLYGIIAVVILLGAAVVFLMNRGSAEADMPAFEDTVSSAVKADPVAFGNKKMGAEFLAKKAKEAGYTKDKSGIVYKVLTSGSGANFTEKDVVMTKYVGKHIDGKEFDSSKGQAIPYSMEYVIPGFGEMLKLMKPGMKVEVIIPDELAYGVEGIPPAIGPCETLVFELETVGVQK